MNCKNQKGFTLIEVIVVAGIIAVLAGILVPMIFNQIDETKKTRAATDVTSIATAIQKFKNDTGNWPIFSAGTYPCVADRAGDVSALYTGGGNYPKQDGSATWPNFNTATNTLSASHVLRDDPATHTNGCYPVSTGGAGWKGPYLTDISADPWGNAYVVNARDFVTANTSVFVLSAGSNGVIDSANTSSNSSGDDITVRLK